MTVPAPAKWWTLMPTPQATRAFAAGHARTGRGCPRTFARPAADRSAIAAVAGTPHSCSPARTASATQNGTSQSRSTATFRGKIVRKEQRRSRHRVPRSALAAGAMALELRDDRVTAEAIVAEQFRRIRIRAPGLFAILDRSKRACPPAPEPHSDTASISSFGAPPMSP